AVRQHPTDRQMGSYRRTSRPRHRCLSGREKHLGAARSAAIRDRAVSHARPSVHDRQDERAAHPREAPQGREPERGGERGAVGATRRDIMQQFLVEAATLTGMGGIAGIAVGLVIGRLANVAMNINAVPPLDLTVLAVFVSVGIGIAFGLLPARRAALLDPIEALRYE